MQFAQLRHQKLAKIVEDLGCNNLKILQDTAGYKFTSDAVLLANFFNAKKGDNVVELCSGSGVISILGTAKTNASHFYLFEIQPELAQMCEQSISLNNLKNITVFNNNLSLAPQILQGTRVDVVLVNPPYFTNASKSDNSQIDIATHERTTTLAKICETSAKLLKHGGKLFMVHSAERFAQICHELIKNKLQPKHAMFVRPTQAKPYSVVLIEATKGAKEGLKFSEIIYSELQENPRDQIQKAKK